MTVEQTNATRTAAETYFESWRARDFGALRTVLAPEVEFAGVFGTANGIDECAWRRRPRTTMWRALFAARSPLRLSRWRRVRPLLAGTGATPQRWAKAASERSRSGLSHADRSPRGVRESVEGHQGVARSAGLPVDVANNLLANDLEASPRALGTGL
jgi:hypothetical protein